MRYSRPALCLLCWACAQQEPARPARPPRDASSGAAADATAQDGAPPGEDAAAQDGTPPEADADAGPDLLPCVIAKALDQLCAHCHASPPTSSATLPLLARSDFLAREGDGPNVAERSLERLAGDTIAPMPPDSEPPADPVLGALLRDWLEQGAPPGECGALPARPAPTCLSSELTQQTNVGFAEMNPGLACRACHLLLAPDRADYFSGTVFSAFHERDLCNSPPPDGARVEILDADGGVHFSIRPNAAGNFTAASAGPGFALPYRARVIANGQIRAMRTPQISGDCNKCHTEQGDEGSPGRIVWPAPAAL